MWVQLCSPGARLIFYSIRTTDTSFVDNPPASSKATPKFSTPAPTSRIAGSSNRGGAVLAARGGAARGGFRGTRGSGLARARGHSVK
jgi:DASH complex subunit DAM1